MQRELLQRLVTLRDDWPDALRLLLATVLAAVVSTGLRLPETYWAVLSAIVVARPSGGGFSKAGRSRLIGTMLGSTVGMGVIAVRAWHMPEIVLLVVAMVPLSLLVTAFEEFRTAPVAAIIILSSSSVLISPLHLALLRLAEVTIGSASSIIVAATVLPARGHGRVLRMAASLIARIGSVLDSSFEEPRDDTRLEASHEDIRRDLRELGLLVRSKGGPGVQGRMVRLLSRLQADSLFVGRVVGTGLRRDTAIDYAHAIHRVCRDLAGCMVDAESADAIRRGGNDLKTATATFVATRPTVLGPVDALDFLLETLGKDLQDFTRTLLGPRSSVSTLDRR